MKKMVKDGRQKAARAEGAHPWCRHCQEGGGRSIRISDVIIDKAGKEVYFTTLK